MRKLTIIILSTIGFQTCAPLGTTTQIYKDNKIHDPGKIGFYTFRLDHQDKLLEKRTDSIFQSSLVENLRFLTGESPVFLGYIKSEEDFEYVKAKSHDQNFILVSALQLTEMFNISSKRKFNSTVRTILIDEGSKTKIIETKFNTNSGKSYWKHPVLDVAIRDGVNGAFRPYKKKGIF